MNANGAINALLTDIGERQVLGFFLVLGRVGPLFVLAPLFSLRMIPVQARAGAALAIAVGIAPLAIGSAQMPQTAPGLIELLAKEILVGMAFAFAAGALIAAVQVAGSFVDTFIGFTFSGLADPISGIQSSVISQLYGLLAVAVFVAIGGVEFLIQGLARTYDLVPLTELPSINALVGGVQQAFVEIFRSALEVVAPVMIALTIVDIGFGLVSRVVPQLNVFAVGFAAKIIVGLVVLAASVTFLGGWMSDAMQQSMSDILEALGGGG